MSCLDIKRLRAVLLISTVLSTSALGPLAIAQTVAPPPVREAIDANGVDLFLGTMNAEAGKLQIGAGEQSASFYLMFKGNIGWSNNIASRISIYGTRAVLNWQGRSYEFINGPSYVSTAGDGATLSKSGNIYSFATSDGTVVRFDAALAINGPPNLGAHIIDATYSNGYKVNYQYELKKYRKRVQTPDGPDFVDVDVYRMKSATSSSGYVTDFTYLVDSPGSNGAAFYRFYTVSSVKQTNSLASGSASQTINTSLDSTGQLYTVTDPLGRQSVYRTQSGVYLAGITRPNSSSEDVTLTYDSSNRVNGLTNAIGTTTYSYSDAAGVRTTTVTDPAGHATIYTFDIALQRMKSLTTPAPISKTTHWDYDTSGRVTRITAPEGNYTQYTYDGRGNVTEARMVAKSGSGIADIVTTSGYDATCSAAAKCNRPNWRKDAKGNQTDYAYDIATGNLLTLTAPSATAGAERPAANYSYTTVNGVQMLSGTSTCKTTASCAGTADEIRTTTAYNSNGLPVSVGKGAGNGSLTATTTIGYDDIGNAITVDGPLAGTADTTRYRFDAARQLVGVVSPDPDGGGSLKPRAQRITYDAKGRVTLVEAGNVNSQSDADWAGFVPQQQLATEYDGIDHKVKEVLSSAGTSYKVTQYSYDAAGRLDCTAVRMNSATWGSLPGACTLAANGAAGPDRITRNTYDNADRLTKVQSAYGTVDQADEVVAAYTDNGKVASVTDGESNKTSYEYDGFDRLSKTLYPVATVGAGTSSGGDYEQLSYDATSNLTLRRLRDGQTISFSYDNLNRITLKDLPGSEPDVSYSYNLLGQVTGAARPDIAHSFGYDALGRLTSETQPFGSISYQYDLAGRRTRMSWWDGFYIDYDYLATGEVLAIRENGATSGVGVLASYGYDQLGRRTGIARGNGTIASYAYDSISRLASFSQNLAGAAYDFTHGFEYNPAGQITSLARSNDAYAWNGHYNVDRGYAINGLNQATAAGPTSIGYDARGNLTSSGAASFTYSSENLLKSAPGVSLYYDALGRLAEYDTSTSTRFVYDAGNMVAEVSNPSGGVLRRYVFGPGADEALVWYEGSGTSDRRWLHADERGSVVAVSDASGNGIGVNSYDEYGIPGSGNIGRFQYTGQAWLPELGMSYYKARIYSPTLGRFMQADPVGYGDGMNRYSYVGDDPINFLDPTGLERRCYQIKTSGVYYDKNGEMVLYNYTGHEECFETDAPVRGTPSIGGGGGAPRVEPKREEGKPCPGPLRRPSTDMMQEATSKALNSVPGGGRSSELTSEFSKVSQLPNFNSGDWRVVGSTHSSASYEHDLGGTGKVVKVYIGDKYFKGDNTVTITDPTGTFEHYANWPNFMMGMPVNARNAAVYLDLVGC